MTNQEITYIIVAAVLLLYSAGLTIALVVMSRKIKQANDSLDGKIQKINADVEKTGKKLESETARLDKHISTVEQTTEEKIKTMGQEIVADATLLIEEKTSDVVSRMNAINNQLNIMDSTVKNLEREKLFVQGMIAGSSDKDSIEVNYTELPHGFADGAKRAVINAAKAGKGFVADYYPIIKKNAPGIAKAAIKLVKKRASASRKPQDDEYEGI
ncbi:MAG: hypothetical protein IJ365_07865 [Clostridia bacterium]|nr:hypothetical protein [Clostridia bacterium]